MQRHVPPVVAFLRVELLHRKQLDDGDAERLQIRDLLDDAGKRAACVGCDAGVRARGEPLDVQLIDDPHLCTNIAVRGRLSGPRHVEAQQTAERGATVGRAGSGAGVAAECGREIHRRGVRIEQHLLGVESGGRVRVERALSTRWAYTSVAPQSARAGMRQCQTLPVLCAGCTKRNSNTGLTGSFSV